MRYTVETSMPKIPCQSWISIRLLSLLFSISYTLHNADKYVLRTEFHWRRLLLELQEQVHLGRLYEQRLLLEARRGFSYEGALALDDIALLECEPPTLPLEG